ncbi:MAG TPA: MerR family transcriptional regulator [Angustibacter sp.]|nr:MerR family transcriptional regulator [Angustibacter sp.]
MRREYTLAEVAAAVGMTERNVRAYRSRGLIRPPRMRGRIGYYSQEHLAQLRLIQALLGRGLSLTVIAQLVDRGVAHTELARLVREELPPGGEVPLSSAIVEVIESAEPGVLGRLADLGLGRRTEDGYAADPSYLAMSNLLVAMGMPHLDVTRISERTAESAYALAERLPSLELDDSEPAGGLGDGDPPPSDADVRACTVELASTAFRLSLTAALERRAASGVSAPER